jgi:tetratricopeptide (TPR) repeat protein
MTFDSTALEPSVLQAIDADASILMKRGIRLVGEARPDAIAEALGCFDAALELRRRLPVETVPVFCYGLAACWLNRADALMRLGDVGLALRAFDEAIVLLRTLPLDDDARFTRRLAIACQNRGLALSADGRSRSDVFDAFEEAIAILERRTAQAVADRDYLLAAVWANLANAHASEAGAPADALARQAALRAIALMQDLQESDADAAEVGLKARHVFSRTAARRLSVQNAHRDAPSDDVHDATDLADDGLSLIRRWEHKGVTRFRDLAPDLFRFGALVYETYQPQFLSEFVLENMDPDLSSPDYVGNPEMQSIARQSCAALLEVNRNRRVQCLGTEQRDPAG